MEELFKKAKLQNPSLTEQDFAAKRQEALKRASSEGHDMVNINGVLMEKPAGDEVKELFEDTEHIGTGN